ncbi:MAG: cupin domain-containing protein [Cyanobacteria bacterium J06638_7]
MTSSHPAATSTGPGSAPTIPYWHVWSDGEGVSHQSRGSIDRFVLDSISAGARAQWIGDRTAGAMTVLFSVLPPGWQGDWHENPTPQWIVPLSGRWGVETMDGVRAEMGPGEVSFGADQGSRERQGKRGHRSWTAGDQPAVLMLVQFGPEVSQPPPPPG